MNKQSVASDEKDKKIKDLEMSIKNIENEYNKKLARKDEEIIEKDNKIQALREEIYEIF